MPQPIMVRDQPQDSSTATESLLGALRISVVIPLFNKREKVERAVRSVLSQSFPGFEIIVVDDGSTDRGGEAVQGIKDSRIRLITQSNRGVSAARNRGIAESRAERIAFLDADDEWLPGFLMAIADLVQKFPTAGVWATNYYFAAPTGERWLPTINGLPGATVQILEQYFKVAAFSDPPLWSSAIAVSKAAILKVGGFPEGVASGEDLLTWAKLAAMTQIAYDRRPWAVYQLGDWAVGVPPRPPDEHDIVADGLIRLAGDLQSEAGRQGVYHYLAWWRKTRASLYLRAGMGKRARLEALKGLRLAPDYWKLYIYLPASLLPGKVFTSLASLVGKRKT